MDLIKPVECYELWNQLKAEETATTKDGWVVELKGQHLNIRSQSITATKAGKQITLSTYWGSEGIARTLLKARHDCLPNSKHHT